MISFSDEVCGVAGFGNPIQVELTKLVMDLECGNNLKDIPGATGLERKKEAIP